MSTSGFLFSLSDDKSYQKQTQNVNKNKKVKRDPKNKSQCIHSKTLVKAFHISHRCIRCYKTIKENDIIGICTQCNIQICKKCYINSKKK